MTIARRLASVRWRKHALRGAITLVVAYLVYLGLGNAFLASDWGRARLNGIDEHVHFEYDSATTLWFGRIHAKRLVIRGSDSSVEWRIVIDDAAATLSPFGAFSRTIRLDDAVARGVELRVRFKVEPAEATRERVAYLPPISGLADPPVRPVPMPPEPTDENYRLWTVDLLKLDVSEVREVWVEQVRVTGIGGSVRGGFFMKPLRRIEIRPTVVHFDDADLVAAGIPIAEHVHGELDVTLRPIDPRSTEPRPMVRALDTTASLGGTLLDLRVVNPKLAPLGVAFVGGGGPIAIAGSIEHGVLAPGTRLGLHARGFAAILPGDHVLDGDAIVELAARATAPAVVLHANATGLGFRHGATALARADVVSLFGTMDDRDLTSDENAWAASIDLPAVVVPDLRLLRTYASLPPFSGGSATGSGHADVAQQRMSARVHAAVTDPTMRIGTKVVHATSVTFDASTKSFDLDRGSGDLSGLAIAVDGADVGDERGFWMHVRGTPARVTLAGGPKVVTHVTGDLANAVFPLVLVGVPRTLGRTLGAGRFTFVGDVTAAPKLVDARAVRIVGDDVDVSLHHRVADGHTRGAGLVVTALPNVGYEVADDGVTIRPLASAEWYAATTRPQR